MIPGMQFEPVSLPPECDALRREVRAFIAEERAAGTLANRAKDAGGFCPEFSRKLGERGWLGVMWPKRYGGQERTALERYAINEEILAARAPTAAHFVAERQSGPLLLRFGTEAQREMLLPAITRGELTFCIGMSEPNSGSDLASVQTTARKRDGGWIINGTKLWTSWAHRAHYMIALVRTAPLGDDRHVGLSQFIVDMHAPGIEIRPIMNLYGRHDFNEVMLTECFVPDDMLVGQEGNGWEQVTSELGYERSGPERFLTTFGLFVELVRSVGPNPAPHEAAVIGRLAAHLMTLRQLSISVAGMLQAGRLPNVEAAIVKDLGTQFEKEIPEIARRMVHAEPDIKSEDAFARKLAEAILVAPQLTIQGGTREILRVVIGRGIGLR